MSRYARIFASIWADPDFVALPSCAQRLYLLLVTQPDVSHCGVLPLTERRWARLAADTDADSVRAALTRLEADRFVIIDDTTEEVLIRSYVKWDGQHVSPNGSKAIEKARSQVLSKTLANLVTDTLQALRQAPTEGASPGAIERDASPLQPAASNRNQQPQPAAPPPGPQPTPPNTAAAAFTRTVDLAVEHRRRHTTSIHNPTGWEKSTRHGIEHDHGPHIRKLLAEGSTPEQIVTALYGTTDPPRTDPAETQARSCAAALWRTGHTPDDALDEALSSWPHHQAAIVDELHRLDPNWTPPPDTPTASVTPFRGAQ